MGGTSPDARAVGAAAGPGDRPPYGALLAGFAAMVALLTVVVTIAAKPADFAWIQTGPVWLDSWFKLDSGWYYSIAANGYYYDPAGESSVAFFPAYPIAVRGLGVLIGDYQIAGTAISVVAGAGAICLFANWVWQRLPRRGALIAIALMMVYPYAFYLYGAMYSDSVFLLAVIAAFLLVERQMFWAAGLVGALATAGRPVGIAIVLGLVVRMLEMQSESRLAAARVSSAGTATSAGSDHGVRPDRPSARQIVAAISTVRWRQAGVLVSLTGLLGWCAYLWVRFGDPLIWIRAQAGWDQASGPHTWFKITYFDTLVHGNVLKSLALTAQLAFCVIAVALLPRVWRSFGWGYLAYALSVLAIPLIGTKDFYGTGRYVLVAFPVVAVAGVLLADSRRRWSVPAVFAVLFVGLIGATCLYGLGLPVS
jgi:hypothetical protein